MFFRKKAKRKLSCNNCNSEVEKNYSFCPYCGISTRDPSEELKDYGILGREDAREEDLFASPLLNLGITDKMMGSIMQNIIKNLKVQVHEMDNTEIQNLPNGIKIKIGMPTQKRARSKPSAQEITEEQVERMSSLPRTTAKTQVRRMSDKVVYELSAPGVQSVQDIFISKLETGYEIKAIGKGKVYVNSLPINLPLKSYALTEKGINVEFKLN